MTRATASVLEHVTLVHHDGLRDATLALANGRVEERGRPGAYRVDLRGHLVFPGLVNAHDHLPLNAIPRLPHAAPFRSSYAWIDAMAAHRERADVAAAVAVPKRVRHWHGALKNLLAGATSVAHHDPRDDALDDAGFPVDVPRGTGWCHSLRLATEGRYGPGVRESHAATPPGAPWVIHLAEGTDPDARGELARLDAMGGLTPNAVLVHGVGLGAAETARLIERGAGVVWCPASNLELLGVTLDPRALADARRLALGTDSRLTGARDLLDELRVAAAHSDLSPAELLRLVTADASAMLRLPDRGALVPGARGDCVIVRAGSHEPYDALLRQTRATLRAVVRGGVPVLVDPDLADWMAACDVPAAPVVVDGRPKLAARWLVAPDVVALEPGLGLAPARAA